MDVVGGFAELVEVDVAGLAGVDAGEDVGVAVDHLRRELQRRPVAAVAVDDDQLGDAVAGAAHADLVDQPRQRLVADAERAGEILVVVGHAVGDQRQHQRSWGRWQASATRRAR